MSQSRAAMVSNLQAIRYLWRMKKLVGTLRILFGITALMSMIGLPKLASAQTIAGDWKGLLKTEAISLRVGLHVSQSDAGYTAKLDILDQAAKGLTLTEFVFRDSTMYWKLQTAEYKGRMQANGKITGEFLQSGTSMPLDFERGEWVVNRPQEPKAPFSYKIEEVTYPNASASDVTLAGTLTIPDQTGPYPAVILISGSGANNRDEEILLHKPFWILSDYLSRNGVAVLRFDDRGVGKSTGKHALATSADFATDALAGVTYLQSRKDLQISSIGLMGHSEGGVIAPLAASQSDAVKFVVMLAGTGVRGDILLGEQTELVMRANGNSEEEISKARSVNEDIYKIILKSKTIRQAKGKLEKRLQKQAKVDSDYTDAAIKAMISQVNNVWMRYFLKHDPAPVLQKVKCPVLAVNGEKDIQVPAKLNLDAIKAALKSGGNQDFTIRSFPDLNHLFQHCTTCSVGEYALLEETFSPEVMAFVGNWILEKGN
jgi:fermentation-respiration switch protein FrsA (DUF1100 family)